MRGNTSVRTRLWRLGLTLVAVYGTGAAILLAVYSVADLRGERFWHFTRDPVSIARRRRLEYYTGSLSYAGVLLWWSGAVAAALAALVLRADPRSVPLAGVALLTAWLALDDLFLLHESFFPRRGIPEHWVVAAYAVVGIAYVWLARAFLRRTNWVLLLTAGGFLAASALADDRLHAGPWEDSANFLGIVGWSVFLLGTSYSLLRETAQADSPSQAGGASRSAR
ncbi:MAG TPA: hypothetical protein VD704_03685 [Gaiellaceae bacterium]|nr:hypothetical protein [Gaiellaceae bacterium]